MQIDVNVATIEQVDEIIEIIKMAVLKMQANGIKQWDENYPNVDVIKNDVLLGNFHVATNNGNIVGMVCVNDDDTKTTDILPSNVDSKYQVIHRICVNPLFNGLGIGSVLMNHAEFIARSNGCKWLKVDTNSSNPYMNAMIEKHGFLYVGESELDATKPVWYFYEKKLV